MAKTSADARRKKRQAIYQRVRRLREMQSYEERLHQDRAEYFAEQLKECQASCEHDFHEFEALFSDIGDRIEPACTVCGAKKP